MTVGDGEPHHGQHVGEHKEDQLVDVVQQGLGRISIWPDHDTCCPLLISIIPIADCGGVEEGGGGHQDADCPDHPQEDGGGLDGKMRRPGPGNGHVPENIQFSQ